MNARWVVAVVVLALVVRVAWADEPQPADAGVVLTGGFVDHVVPADGGRIDWTNGYVLAEGVGYAEGTDKQQELLAQQAARTLAARNALALVQGIQIDESATVGGVRNGVVAIQGLVRGHEVAESQWLPHEDPPRCRLVLRVPLWGVKSVASLFRDSQQAHRRQVGADRWALVTKRVDVSDFVLVLDARGTRIEPCLFPVVTDEQGRTLYDINTLAAERTSGAAPVRYVESELTFEQIQAAVEHGAPQDGTVQWMLASYHDHDAAEALDKPATTQPTSQPAEEPTKRRAKRRMAARVTGLSDDQSTQLVLTREDAERLRRSPEAASAMKNAQVIVVVDSAAAGIEGRLETLSESVLVMAPPSP